MFKLTIMLVAPLIIHSSSANMSTKAEVQSPTASKRSRTDSDTSMIPESKGPAESKSEAEVNESETTIAATPSSNVSLPKRSAVNDLADLATRFAASSIDSKKLRTQNSPGDAVVASDEEGDEGSKAALVF